MTPAEPPANDQQDIHVDGKALTASDTGQVQQAVPQGLGMANTGFVYGDVNVGSTKATVIQVRMWHAVVLAWFVLLVTLAFVRPGKTISIFLAVSIVVAILGYLIGRPVRWQLERVQDTLDGALRRRFVRYDRHFRRRVLSSVRFMESMGLATVGDFTPEIEEIYVDVSLIPRPPHLVSSSVLSDAPVDVGQRMSIWDFLAVDKPVVLAVLGAPGSGKTTLLQHVARTIAQFPKQTSRSIPVLIELRYHAQLIIHDEAISLPDFLGKAMPQLDIEQPPRWWENRLIHGKCAVLLDGLDEVARSDDRAVVAAWVNEQVARYSANNFVVTSRPHGYRTAVIPSAQVLQVRPFTDAQVRQFLHNWYRTEKRRSTGTSGLDVDLLAERAAVDLIDRLAATPALHDLTINPLLLTMIANVHRYRGALPRSRADLYGEVCQVMLWRRQEAKRLELGALAASKERVLALLAFTMMDRHVRDLHLSDVLEVIKPGLERVSIRVEPESFLADVSSNGLLVERQNDFYGFAHLTFQEYLAALHVRKNNMEDVLVAAVGDVWWRETTLLFVAGSNADAIVQACLDSGSINALSLAFDCSEPPTDPSEREYSELAPELRRHLDNIQQSAFLDDAGEDHRRLVASVMASRGMRQFVVTSSGSLICPQPIRSDLYWLFLRDTGCQFPDRPCDRPPSVQTASGIWRSDAVKFVDWLNSLPVSGSSSYRLPTPAELDNLATESGPATEVTRITVSNVWTSQSPADKPKIWSRPNHPSLYAVSGHDLAHHVTVDCSRTHSTFQILSLGVLAHAAATQTLINRACYSRNVTSDFKIVTDVGPTYESGLLPYLHGSRNTIEEIVQSLGGRDRKRYGVNFRDIIAVDHQLMVAHESILSILAGLDPALDREVFRDLLSARERMRERNRTRDQTRVTAQKLSAGLTAVSDMTRRFGCDPLFSVPFTSHLRSVARRNLENSQGANSLDMERFFRQCMEPVVGPSVTEAVHRTLTGKSPGAMQPESTFSLTLVGLAGFGRDTVIHADPASLAEDLHIARTWIQSIVPRREWTSNLAQGLAAIAMPVFRREMPVKDATAGAIRLRALALAAECDRLGSPVHADKFRAVAAGTSVLQRRLDGSEPLESLMLARA